MNTLTRVNLVKLIPYVKPGRFSLSLLADQRKLGSLRSESWTTLFRSTGAILNAGNVTFGDSSRLRFAIEALKMGAQVEDVSRYLDWKEFEHFAAELSELHGYSCKGNIVVASPRRQIDVLASKGKKTIAFDCKHWKKTIGVASLMKIASSHVQRCNDYAKIVRRRKNSGGVIIPVLLTLRVEEFKVVDGVPVVPIGQLNSFFVELSGFEDQLHRVVL